MSKYESNLTDKTIDAMLDGAKIYKCNDGKYVIEFSVFNQSCAVDAKDEKEAEKLAREWLQNVPESFTKTWSEKVVAEDEA